MLTFISLRLNSWRAIKVISRPHSAKPIVQRMYPQEFSFENYDCIGFDLDHTIIKYKLKPLFSLIYKSLASFLIEKYDYPNELSELSDSDFSFSQKGLILDKRRGNILKLDSEYRIVQATHGTRLLTEEDICKIYGANKIWEDSLGVPHKLVLNNALNEPFYVFKDYFVTAGAAICAKMVDFLDQKYGRTLEEYNFWDQYIEGILHMYERDNFKKNIGSYFPNFKKNPEKYLHPVSEEVKKWLTDMSRNKVTFLLTSANFDAAEFSAEFCLGKDWKKYFNLIVTFARKPGFFWKDKPFYTISSENTEVAGVAPKDMNSNFIYSQGNFKDLLKVCSSLSKVKCPKVAYFGDSLMEDVYAASKLAGCDTVAIVEEMLAEGMENLPILHDERQFLLSKFWGSFFSYKTDNENHDEGKSLWSHLLSQHSTLTIPSLEFITALKVEDKIPCFGSNNAFTSGFFPGVPEPLCTATVKESYNQQSESSSLNSQDCKIQSKASGII